MTTEPGASSPVIRCERLEVGWRGRAILPAFDVAVRRQEFWVVIGRNGAGKSTWFKTMLGLIPAVSGQVTREPGVRVSYVPQRVDLDPLFPLAARDVVAMGVERGASFLGLRVKEPPEVRRALEDVDALDLASRPFRDLSEGQKARVLLARLAAARPDVALLDEPTAAMDMVAERRAFTYLDSLRERSGTAIIVVSHYLGLAKEFATHAVFLDRDCNTVVVGTPEEVFGHADFHRSYGRVDMQERDRHTHEEHRADTAHEEGEHDDG